MKALVTGGAGFIGSHLVERLLNDGHEVAVVDDCSTGRKENLAAVFPHRRFSFYNADVTDMGAIRELVAGTDWIFHLAARADIVPSIRHPLGYHRVNVDGTVNILEAAREAGVRRFIYAASSSCYGIPEAYPTPETAPLQPHYPYALTKCVGERYVMHWGRVYGLPVVSLRFFNVYGPRVRTTGAYGAVFGVFLAQKLHGRPFTVVGDGTQTRDFVFVTDVAEACVRAAESGICGEILNVGSGRPVSINRLVELLGGEVVYLPKRPGEPDCTHADISKIRKLLGWEPSVPFEEGVQVMLDGMDYWKDAPLWTPERIEEETREWFCCLGGKRGKLSRRKRFWCKKGKRGNGEKGK